MRAPLILLSVVFMMGAIDCEEPFCEQDEDCAVLCEGQVERLRAPTDAPAPLTAADCSLAFNSTETFQTDETPTCTCTSASGGVALLFAHPDACFATGRLGSCIYGGDDFTTCTPGDLASCDDDCTAFNTARATDAVFAFGDAELVAPHCESRGFSCECSISVVGQCIRQRSDGLNVGACE